MYPNLSYFLHDFFGMDLDHFLFSYIQTFGLLLACAFLSSAYFFRQELHRKSMLGLFPKSTMKDDEGKLVEVYPDQRVSDITIIAAISGILGAKIFAIFESAKTIQSFLEHPISNFFSGSGLAIYGGLVGGFVAVAWFITRKLHMRMLPTMDAVAPALIMGYAVGRIGCQLSGDGDWGIPAAAMPSWWFLPDWAWAFDYPRNVVGEGVPIEGLICKYNNHLAAAVYPTPLYEAILAFLIFGILWILRKRMEKVEGSLFMLYMILNGFERFWIEKIRINEKMNTTGLTFTQAEFIAVLLFFGGIIGWIILSRRAKKIV